jgi:hypothetical protein
MDQDGWYWSSGLFFIYVSVRDTNSRCQRKTIALLPTRATTLLRNVLQVQNGTSTLAHVSKAPRNNLPATVLAMSFGMSMLPFVPASWLILFLSRWSDRKACMSSESSHAMPPRGSKCPSNGWSWSSKFGCCTPQAPPYGEPQCPGGWSWMSGISQCQPHGAAYPTPSGYARRAPEPSVYMASPYTYEKRQATPSGYPSYYEKRQLRSRTVSLCPGSLTACPIEFANGLSSDYECLDTKTELTSCGGCSSTNEGKDCTAIQGSWNVGCVKSTCVGE